MPVHRVAFTKELPPGSALAVEVAGRTIGLFNVDGAIYAIDNICTHDNAPLTEGVVTDGCVVCPGMEPSSTSLRVMRSLLPRLKTSGLTRSWCLATMSPCKWISLRRRPFRFRIEYSNGLEWHVIELRHRAFSRSKLDQDLAGLLERIRLSG